MLDNTINRKGQQNPWEKDISLCIGPLLWSPDILVVPFCNIYFTLPLPQEEKISRSPSSLFPFVQVQVDKICLNNCLSKSFTCSFMVSFIIQLPKKFSRIVFNFLHIKFTYDTESSLWDITVKFYISHCFLNLNISLMREQWLFCDCLN